MLIKPQQLSMMIGPAASGKSFCAFDLAACVAAGVPWLGWGVPAGGAVYLATDCNTELRMKARIIGGRPHPTEGFFSVDARELDLAGSAPGALTQFVMEAVNYPFELVVIDSFTATMRGAGDDEAGVQALYTALEQIDHIMAAFAVHVMLVCHQGKHRAPRGRGILGSTADLILGVADREVMVLKQAVAGHEDKEAVTSRQFKLRAVQVGEDTSSCVVEPV